jgi:hypothetical protein
MHVFWVYVSELGAQKEVVQERNLPKSQSKYLYQQILTIIGIIFIVMLRKTTAIQPHLCLVRFDAHYGSVT